MDAEKLKKLNDALDNFNTIITTMKEVVAELDEQKDLSNIIDALNNANTEISRANDDMSDMENIVSRVKDRIERAGSSIDDALNELEG